MTIHESLKNAIEDKSTSFDVNLSMVSGTKYWGKLTAVQDDFITIKGTREISKIGSKGTYTEYAENDFNIAVAAIEEFNLTNNAGRLRA